jgi:formylglycine-generating enzyme required for sulfatase activity
MTPTLLRWRGRTQAFMERIDGLTLTMVRIPAGAFVMGSPEQEPGRDPDEGPQHRVTLEEFLMAQTPITQEQWRVVAQWQPTGNEPWEKLLDPEPAWFSPAAMPAKRGQQDTQARLDADTSQRPVECVGWDEAMEYCRRLSQRTGRRYTLPSEAQWEYACRGGTTTAYGFGNEINTTLANFRPAVRKDAGEAALDRQQTTAVAQFPANAWGLHDLHGNVWEWCLDEWHETYVDAPRDGRAWLSTLHGGNRVVRGGAWSDPPTDSRSACRYWLPAASGDEAIVGFRVVCLPQALALDPSSPLMIPEHEEDFGPRQPIFDNSAGLEMA